MSEVVSLNETPRSGRLHIGLYGRRNAGKSSLVNAICGHEVALVSDVAGTTTDPVYKSMEIHGLGPCVLIDTAGFDDEGALGALRVEKTMEAVRSTDAALLLFDADAVRAGDFEKENEWLAKLRATGTPVLGVLSKRDLLPDAPALADRIKAETGLGVLTVSASDPAAQGRVRAALLNLLPEGFVRVSLTGRLVKPGDTVLLVMPQDIQAPEGRLILPQVQVTRDLLDHHALVVSCTAAELDEAFAALKTPPALIITDSQVFPLVYGKKPKESRLTSFSVLLAAAKGDIHAFVDGADRLDTMTERSRVLIAEACTHAPLEEDIGRVKIPRMLRKRFGEGLRIDMVSGQDFPANLTQYDLIVHCGACMFNRKYMLGRVAAAADAGVAITNYGVLLAKLAGILGKIEY